MYLDFSNIGKRLQQTRINRKITQHQMAKYLEISMSDVENLENGKATIEFEKFIKLCNFLNISILDVLNEKNNHIIGYMDKELYELIITCNLEKQKFIYNMVKLLIKDKVV